MESKKPKRSVPIALLLVLGGIVLTTLAMCGVGGWMIYGTLRDSYVMTEQGRGPTEVRSAAFHVAMRAWEDERQVELFEGALARQGWLDAVLRRHEPHCDAQLYARHIGPDAELIPWMDIAFDGTPGATIGPIAIPGLDHDGTEREYTAITGTTRRAIGFVRNDDVFVLNMMGDADCPRRALDSLVLLEEEAESEAATAADVSAATFTVTQNRFESLAGLVIEVPPALSLIPWNTPFAWFEGDEAVFRHENGTDVHIARARVASDHACVALPTANDTFEASFDNAPRVFEGSEYQGRHSYVAHYCDEDWFITIGALGPSATRTQEAIRSLEDRVTVRAPATTDRAGHQRAGGDDWTWRNDTFRHYPTGLAWQRTPQTEVRTLGANMRRISYPESRSRFDFMRRDLEVSGAFFAHETALSAGAYHTAFVEASYAHLGLNADMARSEASLAIAACEGTRTSFTGSHTRIVIWTCVRNGQALALELLSALRPESEAFAETVIASFSTNNARRTSTLSIDDVESTLAIAAEEAESWSADVALGEAVSASSPSFTVGLGRVQSSRIFASTTPVTHTEVSGFPAEERHLVIGDRALRVYSVIVDATAYVISIRGPASTPESAWSEMLARVHIDP